MSLSQSERNSVNSQTNYQDQPIRAPPSERRGSPDRGGYSRSTTRSPSPPTRNGDWASSCSDDKFEDGQRKDITKIAEDERY